jgi:hypothetical protein
MDYVKVENGNLTAGPFPLTDDRTASPNTDWQAEQLAANGFMLVDLSCEPGQKVDYEHWTIEGGVFSYARIPKVSQDYVQDFDLIKFQSDLSKAAVANKFTMDDPVVEFAPLNTFATNSDFLGMKQYLGWRISKGKAQAADYAAVNTITQLQNINLEDF